MISTKEERSSATDVAGTIVTGWHVTVTTEKPQTERKRSMDLHGRVYSTQKGKQATNIRAIYC